MKHEQRVFNIGVALGELLRSSADLASLVDGLQVARTEDAIALSEGVALLRSETMKVVALTRAALNNGAQS